MHGVFKNFVASKKILTLYGVQDLMVLRSMELMVI